jgi:Ser-tRNA(Ala) deacylase AlaX
MNRKESLMCTNGINAGQIGEMIDQIDDHVALEYRWAHKLAHTAGHAGFAAASGKLHAAQALLADARAALDEAKSALESDAQTASASGMTVHLV